ncbi:hypothetical protein Bca4012_025832 [Brassica carinata]
MADSGPASFLTQANAILRKNLTYQKRNIWSNVRLIMIPFYLCVVLVGIQALFDSQVNKSLDNQCGCKCIYKTGDEKCQMVCGVEYSTRDQGVFCAIPIPQPWPPLILIPLPRYSVVDANLTDVSCRQRNNCPVTILLTGNNQSLGATLSRNLLRRSFAVNYSDLLFSLADNVLATTYKGSPTNYLDAGIVSDRFIYNLQPRCTQNSNFSFSVGQPPLNFTKEMRCVQGLNLWRNSSREVNNEIFKGYQKGNAEGMINEIVAAYDLLDTNRTNFNVNIWYNSTYLDDSGNRPPKLLRLPRLVSLVSNAYLQYLRGPRTRIVFEFVKEMPKPETKLRLDIASLIGAVFFTWVILLLFPVILTSLVYEKQQRLRIIMKMHGLGDGPYWMISYAYFLTISTLYVICLMIFGSAIVFSKVETASVVAYIYVFGSGLLGWFLFQFLIEDLSFPRHWIFVMELYPGFSLFRGLYEFSQYAFQGNLTGRDGMKWKDISDSSMDEVFYIIILEWFFLLISAYYIDKMSSSGKGLLFYLKNPFEKFLSPQRTSLQNQVSAVSDKLDVIQESEKVEKLMRVRSTSHAIVCDKMKKVYPGRDGNPPKIAVQGLSLAVPSGECFGMLGPNGAGKTSFINMMTGLVKPTSGSAFVQGLDICTDMDRVYTSMGVCPQHDLLWETLSGREHLLFYGRLKNLKNSDLEQAVEESLKNVNLLRGGVAEKPAGKYSGGMKRRLSVAISLIGSPKVVYMDEPSTGLDPASRMNLWTVIKRAKTNTAIILTTHSMEEAEFLCDRLGIFVDGRLQCIGNPKELKGRYGGSYVLTMTTAPEHEKDVEMLVQDVSPNAKKLYHIAGTQKFEIPKEEVRISQVFEAVEKAKRSFKVFAWGLADTTLEDVFIKVARNGLPDESCRRTGTCPVTVLFTGNNHSLGASLFGNLLPSSVTVNTSDPLQGLAYNVLGTEEESELTNYLDPGIASNLSIYSIQSGCISNAAFPFSFGEEPLKFQKELRCAQGFNLWRNNSREVNDVIFKGYRKGNPEGKTNEIAAAYDLLNTDRNNFNVHIWYNSTYNDHSNDRPSRLLRVPGLVNLVSNAYLHFLQGPGTKMLFEYVKEVPKLESKLRLDIASLIGPLFFTWVILLLFPVILSSLVYEKQEHLRIIMKMHGLGDGPYWMISYAYFLSISMLYFICLMIFGSAIGLNFFRLNDYSIQFTFYFLYVNLQIALCFLVSSIFSKVKTSTVASYIYVFLSALVGTFLLQFLVEDSSFSRGWIIVLELFPPFSLYRGLYEFGEFAFRGNLRGADGMKWKDFSDSAMDEVFIIIIIEWFLALIAACYIDKIVSSGKNPLFFLKNLFKKSPPMRRPSLQRQGSKVVVEMEKPDVTQEIEKVEQLTLEPSTSHAIVCDNLKKVYPGRDGNPPKLAVRGLSLAVPSGECFGMLGPNGAGKTSFINMMTGLLKPTSGTGLVRGLDICNDMDRVYTSMGVCPQHDLLWETLTGKEHLLFYGRLKNLKGSELIQAVEESLKSVNLFHGGVADRPAGKYSGGMKRRLSVAISLIGNPKVVYMDEPSTGLDPASRKNLWTVIKRAKQNTAIILTTHSMEEAEFLCDRLGIFVDGSLQCIGNPKELKGRYGGSYVFTMTTSSEHEGNVEKLIQDVSPNAKKIYHIAGTQKFELPKEEVRISEVFQAVETCRHKGGGSDLEG